MKTNESKEYFKVVSVVRGQLKSICQNPYFPDFARVTYKKDEEVFPNVKGTKLFVFDNLIDAKYFASTIYCVYQIWKCEVTNPGKANGLLKKIYHPTSKKCLEEWLKQKISGSSEVIEILEITVPSGTIAVDSVKLVEKMYEFKYEE